MTDTNDRLGKEIMAENEREETDTYSPQIAILDIEVKGLLAKAIEDCGKTREEIFTRAGYKTSKSEWTKLTSPEHTERNLALSRAVIVMRETNDHSLLKWLAAQVGCKNPAELQEDKHREETQIKNADDFITSLLKNKLQEQEVKLGKQSLAIKMLVGIVSTQLSNKFLDANLEQILKLLE